MGKSRRRNTAKTGDKALYAKRSNQEGSKDRSKDDDAADADDDMYDRVDRHHNRLEQDFLRLNGQEQGSDDDDDDDGNYNNIRPVMDLGIGASDDEDSDDDDESSSEDGEGKDSSKAKAARAHADDDDDEAATSDDDDDDDNDDDDEEEEPEDVRDWGKRKASYYHGDTADLEIGQDQDDAFLEEEAAREIHKARMTTLAEEDFEIDDEGDDEEGADEQGKGGAAGALSASSRGAHRLTRREKRKIIERQSPEFLPLVEHFTGVVRELHERTNVAVQALFEGEEGAAEAVGATPLGCEYLLTKAIIETASALNLASYLLLKRELPASEAGSLSYHPVLSRLQKLHKQAATLEEFTAEQHPELNDQLDKLVEAAALMKDGVVPSEVQEEESDAADADESENGDEGAEESDRDESETDGEGNDSADSGKEPADKSDKKAASTSSSSDDDSDSEDEDARRRSVLNEARFALRPAELMQEAVPTASRKRRPAPDFGEDEEQEAAGKKSKAFAATLNSIQQRSRAVPKKSKMAEDLDEFLDRDDDIMADEAEEEAGFTGLDRSGRSKGEDEMDPEMDDDDDDDEGGDFYSAVSRKSKSRKEVRKAMHQVAPKFPRVEREIDGERTVSKQILKNRGLVPHKNRLNRNPRVKKREQYRKAQIRRRGVVREIRTDEGHKYGGEGTGIKTGLSRSRKLA